LKNTVALSVGRNVFVSQHIGDLDTEESFRAFQAVVKDFAKLYDAKAEHVVCDLHPDYLSTQFARGEAIPCTAVQHHYAHVAACMAENQLDGELLGVSWDGTGLGLDGTIWGGEFLLTDDVSFERLAWLRPFPLPGGERAIKEPRRSAIGLLYAMYGPALLQKTDIAPLASFSHTEIRLLCQMLENRINSPTTSSVGRLFDAVASIVGLRHTLAFEGQAAMELEFCGADTQTAEAYSFELKRAGKGIILDWAPLIEEILVDLKTMIPLSLISAKFHNTLAEMILRVALHTNQKRVVLTGGCFQNKYLTEKSVQLLTQHGIKTYWHQRIPPNDGGIALGQISAYARLIKHTHTQEVSAEETL
jgi:hydrogenase maturation protein HypF